METLKTNYTSRIRFRKVIVLFEAIGFTFYLVGFTTPYWVSFLSTKSMLTSTRGLFATCVTTAGQPKCANIEHYTGKSVMHRPSSWPLQNMALY